MIPTAFLASAALSFTLSGVALPTAPISQPDPQIPEVTADSWIVYDLDADVVLARWNADVSRSMASVTKVMSAMIVLDNAELDDIVTVPRAATSVRGSTAGLAAGEEWSVNDLLIAMLLRSGHDAAVTLAIHVGGSVDGFVDMMNAKAAELGMKNTSFANPNGLDHEDHYSTATDLLTLTKASLEYPDIGRIARTRFVQMPEDPDGRRREWRNTNALLGAYPGVVGLKTGDTPWADKVLLGVAERPTRTILTVGMHSDDHFGDTRELVDWGSRTYTIRDRFLRVFFAEQGGGAAPGVALDLSESHERRLAQMPRLDDGRWRTSRLEDLPKAALIGEWLRGGASEDGEGSE
jgi:D-alanyl-D-alanine carboxypeptidase